jgi:predicted CoA-binding protein
MNDEFTRPADIEQALRPGGRIAIVGLSPRPERDSNEVAQYLIENGYEVVPVNPVEEEILGLKSYPDLSSVPGHIDVVDIFRKPEAVGPIVEEAIRVGADSVWMQLGVVNSDAATVAREAGLGVIMDRCMKVEHFNHMR